jgi:hypothetical protein
VGLGGRGGLLDCVGGLWAFPVVAAYSLRGSVMERIRLGIDEGVALSLLQGEGAMGSLSRGSVEACLVAIDEKGDVLSLIGEPFILQNAEHVASWIHSYLQDQAVGWEYQ